MIVGGDEAKVIEMINAPAGYVTSSYTTGDITSTTTPTNITVNDVLFNLAGQRVAQPSQRGVYIVGGKKVVVK